MLDSTDRSHEFTPATVLTAVAFLVFALMMAGLITDTFRLDDRAEAWVGAALVGLGSAAFGAWAAVIHLDTDMSWAERAGGDLLVAALGVALFVTGAATFAAGVI